MLKVSSEKHKLKPKPQPECPMSKFEEPPRKKRKEEEEEEEEEEASPWPWSWLPDDLVMSCMARVSRLDHPTLSLVCKSYRSLVASPEIYKTRSLMGLTETYVYVCLRTPPPDPKPRWFILRRRETLNASVLMPIPSLPSQPPEASSVVVLDWFIYVIGGSVKEKARTSDVWLLDCRTHTWRHIPSSMGVARANAAARVIDGKIYVIGGCDVFNPNTWGEVFDPKTQSWSFLAPVPLKKGGNQNLHDSVVMDQKIYVVDGNHRTYFYSPSKGGYWGRGNRGQVSGCRRDWCMIDNRIYFLTNDGTIFSCEHDELYWPGREGIMMDTKEVKGLGSLEETLLCSRVVHFGQLLLDRWKRVMIKPGIIPQQNSNFGGTFCELEDTYPGARLVNFGGNIGLFWDVIKGDHLEIWCAEISLERRQGGEIWGNIEWSNAVMTVDPFLDRYKVLYSVSVTL